MRSSLPSELGLAGRAVRKRRSLTRQGKRPAAPDLVRRNFTAVAPDVLWCGDVTEIVTDEGKLSPATVEDLFSRRLLGYAMSEHHDATLTIASLQMAAVTRGGTVDGLPPIVYEQQIMTMRTATKAKSQKTIAAQPSLHAFRGWTPLENRLTGYFSTDNSYDLRVTDQQVEASPVLRRAMITVAVLLGDGVLFAAVDWILERVRYRGVLCDGDSVFCAGGDPTRAEWLAEMQFRNTVAYPLLAAVVVILTLTAAVAWKHRRREIVLTQSLALLLAFALLVMWKPYRHVEDFQPPLLGSRMDVATNHQPRTATSPSVRKPHSGARTHQHLWAS